MLAELSLNHTDEAINWAIRITKYEFESIKSAFDPWDSVVLDKSCRIPIDHLISYSKGI